MRKEIIIEKEDYKFKVAISLYGDNWYEKDLYYRFDWIKYLPKRKCKWISLSDEWREGWDYRNTPYDKRSDFMKNKYLEVLTVEDIKFIKQQLFNEICEKLNPSSDNNCQFTSFQYIWVENKNFAHK